MAHVFAHTYADNCNVRCTHTTHTHTHVHTAGCPRACACTGASSPPTHRADTPTDQGHSTRSLVCCTACTSASVPACPAKNFAPLGPRAAFLSVCLIVTLNGPHRPFPTYLRALQIFLHICLLCLPVLCKFALQYFACTAICTAIAYVADFAIKECAICMRCNTCKICKSAHNCVQFACKFGLRMCMLAFAASTLQICTAIAYVADFPIKECAICMRCNTCKICKSAYI